MERELGQHRESRSTESQRDDIHALIDQGSSMKQQLEATWHEYNGYYERSKIPVDADNARDAVEIAKAMAERLITIIKMTAELDSIAKRLRAEHDKNGSDSPYSELGVLFVEAFAQHATELLEALPGAQNIDMV